MGDLAPPPSAASPRGDAPEGNFDVVDMRDPLPEAYELVEDGDITEAGVSRCVPG